MIVAGIALLVVSTLWLGACVQYQARYGEVVIGMAVWAVGLLVLALGIVP